MLAHLFGQQLSTVGANLAVDIRSMQRDSARCLPNLSSEKAFFPYTGRIQLGRIVAKGEYMGCE